MWLQHPALGHFSIVLADDLSTGKPDPNTLMIRARRREHLQLLKDRHTALGEFEIIESTASHDYRWRMIVPKVVFAEVASALVMDLDYRNVKGEAHRCVDDVGEEFVSALHRTWAAFHAIQDGGNHA